MHPVRITAKLSVAKQPAVEDFSALAAAGFTAIINNRPNGEEEGQPGSAAEQHAAQAAGLAYSHIPVTGPSITEADVRRFQSAVAGATGPVLGHCKSGTRSLTLWVIGEVLDGRMRAADVRAFGEDLGFDLKGAEAWLAQHGDRGGRS
jgi:uncharacterized protein (TIGR01244 family)